MIIHLPAPHHLFRGKQITAFHIEHFQSSTFVPSFRVIVSLFPAFVTAFIQGDFYQFSVAPKRFPKVTVLRTDNCQMARICIL